MCLVDLSSKHIFLSLCPGTVISTEKTQNCENIMLIEAVKHIQAINCQTCSAGMINVPQIGKRAIENDEDEEGDHERLSERSDISKHSVPRR